MQNPRPTVAGAVTACLAFCQDSPDRDTIVALFIRRLQENPDWTAAEVADIQRQIEARLQGEIHQAVATSPQNTGDRSGS